MKVLRITILFVFAALICEAQLPNTISYQGIITNPTTGETAANGAHSVKFAFYDAAVDGNLKWQTSVIQVTTFKGLFATMIPVPSSATWDQLMFVELTVDGTVLSSRIQLTVVPYAFRAATADVVSTMNASGLTGTILDARLSEHLQDLADGTLTGSKVGQGVSASHIDNGVLPNAVLDEDLRDLADDGVLPGEKIGPGISAANITRGTIPGEFIGDGIIAARITDTSEGLIPNTSLDGDLQDLADDGILQASHLENLDAAKITSGVFASAQIPALDASKITSGVFSESQIPTLNASKISGVFDAARIPTLEPAKISGGAVTGAGTTNKISYWTNAGTVGATSLHWDAAEGELGIGVSPVVASIDILHGDNHPTGTSMRIRNYSTLPVVKNGITLELSNTADGQTAYGINSIINGDGNGTKIGVAGNASSSATSINLTNGIYGQASGSGSGSHYAIRGICNPSGVSATPQYGVYAVASGSAPGVKKGVMGLLNSDSDSDGYGVHGQIQSNGNGSKYGISGEVTGTGGGFHYGVWGSSSGGALGNFGVYGTTASNAGIGVYGTTSGAGSSGVLGSTSGTTSSGVTGVASTSGSYGVRGNGLTANGVYGVYGNTTGTGSWAIYGNATGASSYGVYGVAPGLNSYGVYGTSSSNGVFGTATADAGVGVYGFTSSNNAFGVYGSTSGTNSHAIYGTATGAGSNAIYANGNAYVTGNLTVGGNILCNNPAISPLPSDRKLKKGIVQMPLAMQKILELRPVNYFFRKSEFPALHLDDDKQFGLIAQEVEEVFPELVEQQTMPENLDGATPQKELSYKSLDYISLVPILIKGMQEQQAMIDELKSEVKKLKSENQAQNNEKRFVKASLKN